jgi:hypothetical protein
MIQGVWQGIINVTSTYCLSQYYFLNYAKQACSRFDLVDSIISFMDRSGGMIRVSQLCDIFNITPRSLEREKILCRYTFHGFPRRNSTASFSGWC